MKELVVLVGALLLARVLPILDPSYANFTPVFAVAIFFPLTQSKLLSYSVPLGVMFLTDLFLGFSAINLVVYFVLALIISLSRSINNYVYTSIIGIGLWHVIVNFFVWLSNPSMSLLQTYAMAIPFDFKLLLSTLVYGTALSLLLQRKHAYT
jgi:hypothetical protein